VAERERRSLVKPINILEKSKMTSIDIGNGQTVQRHHLPGNLLRELDEASATFSKVQASVRAWIKTLLAMQAPANFSGVIDCRAVGQSGRTYGLSEVGGALLVDQRDTSTFSKIGFTYPPGTQPTSPRVGLVFLDTATGEYLRWNGSAWAPITLE
jgi:hypothetical protein